MMKRIEYTSPNNRFTGVLYGESSMSIYDPDGKEILHTGRRTINTYEKLVEEVEEFPAFRQMLLDKFDQIYNEDEDEDDI